MPETKSKTSPIDFVLGKIRGWTSDYSLTQRWTNIKFTENGSARMYSIFGFIAGLHAAGKTEEAERYANELVELFDRLNTVQEVDHEVEDRDGKKRTVKVPLNKIEVSADHCLHSFNFARYSYVEGNGWENLHEFNRLYEAKEIERPVSVFENRPDPYSNALYRLGTVGGIVYHGPGQGETFTVTLGDDTNLWGIHT